MAENKEKKVLNVPNLRFPEFEGEWEKCKVSELLDFYSTNSLSWDKLEYGTNAIQNLHYGLIHVGLPTMVDLDNDKLPNIVSGNTPKNYELCQEGDIAFADASEDTNEVAKAVEFYNLNGKDVICGLHTIHGRDNQHKTIVGYKGYAFSSTAFHQQIRRIAQGTKIYSINNKNFSECYIGIPSKGEQKKIATLLRLIDERISTQNKIIEELKKLKVCVRRLIFRTLNCSWFLLSELEASGDICLKRGNVIPKHEHTDIFCYPVYSSSVQNGGLMGYNNTYMFNTELVTWSIDGGGNFFYRHKHKFNVTNVSGYMQLNEAKYNYRFVSEILLWQHSFMVFDYQTKAHPSVIRSIYKLPDVSLAEQELIANIFRLLDVKLQNEMTILKQYQQQKQYLLCQMFI